MYNKNIFDFTARWPLSNNNKDIGMHLTFTAISGVAGKVLSMYIKINFANTNFDFLIYNFNLYNVITTVYAFIIIFFLVMPLLIGGFDNWFVIIYVLLLFNSKRIKTHRKLCD